MRPQNKKRQAGGKVEKKKEKRQKAQLKADEAREKETSFFLDDEEGPIEQSDEEEEDEPETAEEKRIRLAKAYLKQLRSSGASLGEDDTGDGEGDLDDDALAAKLKQQAQEVIHSPHDHASLASLAEAIIAKQAKNFLLEGFYSGRSLREYQFLTSKRQALLGAGNTPGGSSRVIGETSKSCLLRYLHALNCSMQKPLWDAVTAMALTFDDSTVYTVGKEGGILKFAVETGQRSTIFKPKKGGIGTLPSVGPEWVRKGPRHLHAGALLTAAVSSDGQLLAVGGGDRKVHVWDTRSDTLIQSFPGHKDAITGLAFRQGTHELYSASYDRSIKLWSLDDRAYVDTLFGHQAEVLAVDALRQERIVSSGHDHTCRVWKIAEESQLIYRGHATAIDCCRYVTGTEWITGGNDGTLSLWSQLKKKPAWNIRTAHDGLSGTEGAANLEAGWIQSVAVCRGSDLAASGAADGFVRLWQIKRGAKNSRTLEAVGEFTASGYINSLCIASSGRFVLAGTGLEPRLGRWGQAKNARSGVLLQPLNLRDSNND